MGQTYYKNGRQYTAAQLKEMNDGSSKAEEVEEIKEIVKPLTKADLRKLIEEKAKAANVELTETVQSFLVANKTTIAKLTEYLNNDNNFVLEPAKEETETEIETETETETETGTETESDKK